MQAVSLQLCAVSLLAVVAVGSTACNKLKGAAADGGDDGAAAAVPAAALGASLSFLGTFEGAIEGFTKDNKPGATPTQLALLIKGGKVRFEIPEQLSKGAAGSPLANKGYVILDSTGKKLDIVSDAEKEAIVIDLNSVGKMIPPSSPTAPPSHGSSPPAGTPTKVTKTGKTDTVAGYKCEYWDIASDHREGTVCMADEGASWLALPLTGIPTERAWMLELLDGKHFPLRFISYGKDGVTEDSRIEVSKIDKKSLADTQFQVPAGYKTIDVEKMMQGLGGMPGMPRGIPTHH